MGGFTYVFLQILAWLSHFLQVACVGVVKSSHTFPFAIG